MSKNTCTAVSVAGYLECQICLDTWRNPVQLLKCGHIFCSQCVSTKTSRCFICRSDVVGTQAPDDKIAAAALAVPVVCSSCGWRGTRGEAETHRCDSTMTHSRYAHYPQRTDEQWVRAALANRSGGPPSETAIATADEDGLQVSTQYGARDVITGIPL